MFPDFASLERLLAFHCAPALAGIKPACLVSLPVRGRSSLSRELAGLGAELAAASIRLLSPVCLQKPPAAFGVSHEPAPGTPVQPGTSCLFTEIRLRRSLQFAAGPGPSAAEFLPAGRISP